MKFEHCYAIRVYHCDISVGITPMLVLSEASERGGAGLSFELLYVRIAILLAEIQTFVLSLVIFLSAKLIMCLVRTYGSVPLLLCIRTMSVIGLYIYCVTGFFSVWSTQCLLIIAFTATDHTSSVQVQVPVC